MSRDDIDMTKTDDEGFTALDIAITHGQYDSAILLYRAGAEIKSIDFYKTKRDIFTVKQVNVTNFIDNLKADNDMLIGKLMQNRDEVVFRKKYKDPVVDPSESWGHMMGRMVDFKKPPLVNILVKLTILG